MALGASSIGEIDGVYVQNIANEPEYVTLTNERGFATYRGHDMSAEDEFARRHPGADAQRPDRPPRDRGAHGIDFGETFALELEGSSPWSRTDS